MSNVNINYEAVTSAANFVTTHHESIVQSLTQLKSQIDSLQANGFQTDQAGPQFQEAYNQFNTGASQVINNLPTISQYLHQVVSGFQQLDQQLASGAGA
jgi:WXG100 family type VII secretion target